MLDEGSLHRQNVEARGGGQGPAHEHGVTLVSYPTGHGIKMGGIISTLVQCEDRDKVHIGLGDIEDIAKLQLVTACDAKFNVTDANGIDGRPPQSFNGMAWDAFEDLEVGCLWGNMASCTSVKDEWEVSDTCDVAATSMISSGGHCGGVNQLSISVPVNGGV